MSMDGLAIASVIAELTPLIGGKIDKVQQPERDSLLLTVRAGGKNSRLLLCCHAENGRIQLTKIPFSNPVEAPAFCMMLRKRLIGSRIAGIAQTGLDRVVTFSFEGRDDMQDAVEYRLVVELMGKYSNMIFVQPNGVVADSIRHVTPAMSSVRSVLPGLPYIAPIGQGKRNPLHATTEDLSSVCPGGEPSPKLLTELFEGLSRQTAAYLAMAAPSQKALSSILNAFLQGRFSPVLIESEVGDPIAVEPFPIPPLPLQTVREIASMSDAYDLFCEKRDAVIRIQRHSAALKKSLETHLSRALNKRAIYEDAITGEEKYEEYRLFGELLTANAYCLKNCGATAVVENYYLDPPENSVIPLNPMLSVQENAQQYFKKYRKSKTARDYALQQRDALLTEIDYLEGQLNNISLCDTLAELQEIRDELVREGYLRPERKKTAAPQNERLGSSPMCFLSRDGIRIFVGKNNRQNDQLTLKTADGENLWFHTKNIPGSHVIVDALDDPPATTIEDAAMLAAYFSKARGSASVPVDYTKRRFIKKPAGAHPGFVIYSTNRTIYVTPDETTVKRLLPG